MTIHIYLMLLLMKHQIICITTMAELTSVALKIQ